jgi:hypothetical protein
MADAYSRPAQDERYARGARKNAARLVGLREEHDALGASPLALSG